jgi:hypothetical protein
LVGAVSAKPVAMFIAATCARGITRPDESVTVPFKTPKLSCLAQKLMRGFGDAGQNREHCEDSSRAAEHPIGP